MPRRGMIRDRAVVARATERLQDAAERRRTAAQRGAETRRLNRAAALAGAEDVIDEAVAAAVPPRAADATDGRVARHTRPVVVHPDMVTVAMRGPEAERLRLLATRYGKTLKALLIDMMALYEQSIANGEYDPDPAAGEEG